MATDSGGGNTETPQTSDASDPLERTADVLKGGDERSEAETEAAQDSIDSRLERRDND